MADGQQPPRRRRRPHGAGRFLACAAAVAALTTSTPAAAELSPAERAGGHLAAGIVHTEAAVWDAAAAAGPSGVLSPDAAAWSAAYAAEVADAAAAAASAAFATAHPWWSAAARLPAALQRWATAPPGADGGGGGTDLDSVTARQMTDFSRILIVEGTQSSFTLALDDAMGPAEADAVAAAARLWANEWPSTISVRVQVRWPADPLPSLGAASTPLFLSGGADGTRDDTSYGAPLYLSLTGQDVVSTNEPHIDMRLNRRVRWHTDPGRDAPSDRWDLTTVAAHELGHGLFFTGRVHGNATTSTARVLASGTLPETARFDSFIADLDDNGVIASCSPGTRNDPTGLYNAVTARGLAFLTNGSAGGFPPTRLPLYAPKPFDTGSSVYHFDGPLLRDGCAASGIPAADCSSLMEAALPSGKTARALGANTLRVMRVMREQALDGVAGGTCAVSPLAPGSTGGSGAGGSGLFGEGGSLPSWAVIALGATAAVVVVLLTATCFANVVLPKVQRRSRRRRPSADRGGGPAAAPAAAAAAGVAPPPPAALAPPAGAPPSAPPPGGDEWQPPPDTWAQSPVAGGPPPVSPGYRGGGGGGADRRRRGVTGGGRGRRRGTY